ncbi:tyrosine-type recombinase/integrase [Bombiscardovia coagulans]|uniref:Phage integrase family protein n=1 Tax=Bombiscardovia coagulans TaxID=686666 RepID=A0A261ESH1_9BIFI|nr:site-specific integrase [Bombiscardovia coagulans]OZG49809.1 phage integrase family protein [Bombiscardovia coagulans]
MAQVTLDDVIARYLAPHTHTTRSSYKSIINTWLVWCNDNAINPLMATASHIEVYGRYIQEHLDYSTRYRSVSLSVICNLYKQLTIAGLVRQDPSPYVRRPRVSLHSEGSYLTREQARDLLQAAQHSPDLRLDALIRLLLLNGCRITEAISLTTGDHHTGHAPWLRLPRKGQWHQQVAITAETSQALDRISIAPDTAPIFRRDGEQLPVGAARRLVVKLCMSIGLDHITPHSLRRTFATLSRDAGVDDKDIMAAGGWTSSDMLDYYDMHSRALNGTATTTLSAYLS